MMLDQRIGQNPTARFSLILKGCPGSGKRTIASAFSNQEGRLGIVATRRMVLNRVNVSLQLINTGEADPLQLPPASELSRCFGLVLLYDVTSTESFRWARTFLKALCDYYEVAKLNLLILGNKADSAERQVSESEGKQLALGSRALFAECSARERGEEAVGQVVQFARRGIEGRQVSKQLYRGEYRQFGRRQHCW